MKYTTEVWGNDQTGHFAAMVEDTDGEWVRAEELDRCRQERDTLLALGKGVLDFQFSHVMQQHGYQEAMRQWVAIRRKIRKAISDMEAQQ